MSKFLELSNINMLYRSEETSSVDTLALKDLNFNVDKAESVVLLGPSGCGKSTALLLASGLLKPTSGTVTLENELITKPRFETALILQNFGLLPWKNVFENASLALKIRKTPHNELIEKTNMALEQVNLSEFSRAMPKELSGGMKQRLAIARALTIEADLLLLDEPLSALDTLLRESLQDFLLELWKKRKHTQILVTHSIEEAAYLGSRILVMTPRPGSIFTEISNPEMGSKDYRSTDSFHKCCLKLREALISSQKENSSSENELLPQADMVDLLEETLS